MAECIDIESLTCSLCLDVFDEATLLNCGHSFCRKCLEKVYQCQPHEDKRIACPLCRQVTQLGSSGVSGLPRNVSMIGLVDELNSVSNPLGRLYEEPRCSRCKAKTSSKESIAAVACRECGWFMCEQCRSAHEQLFVDHKLMNVEEFMAENVRVTENFDNCKDHKTENREFYCADCRVIICHKCTIVKHNVRDHLIRERSEFEIEIREKINALIERSLEEKKVLENQIREIEKEREDARKSIEVLEGKIDATLDGAIRRLEERRDELKGDLKGMRGKWNEKLDTRKATARKLASQLSGSADMLAQGRRGGLEGDSLVSHDHLCEELEGLLQTCHRWSDEAGKMAGKVRSMAAGVEFKETGTDINIGGIDVPGEKWTLCKEIELSNNGSDEPMNGLASVSRNEVVVGYGDRKGVDIITLDAGNRTSVDHSSNMKARGITHLTNGCMAVTDVGLSPPALGLRIYDDEGNTGIQFETINTKSFKMLDSDTSDRIFVTYWDEKLIHVFRSTGGQPERTMKVKKTPRQVHTTRCGKIVVQSYDGVRVLSDVGKQLTFIPRPGPTTYCYPAVDEHDNLIVACIDTPKGVVSIKRYTLDGVYLETVLDDIEFKIPKRNWYYMKCPSPDAIVFCTAGRMYIFKRRDDDISDN